MLARALQLLVFAALLLVPALPAFAAYTYDQGQTVALGFSSLSSAYDAYWFSDSGCNQVSRRSARSSR